MKTYRVEWEQTETHSEIVEAENETEAIERVNEISGYGDVDILEVTEESYDSTNPNHFLKEEN